MMQFFVRNIATLGCIESVQDFPDHYLLIWKGPLTHSTVHSAIFKTLSQRSLHSKQLLTLLNESIEMFQSSASAVNHLATCENPAKDIPPETSLTNTLILLQ